MVSFACGLLHIYFGFEVCSLTLISKENPMTQSEQSGPVIIHHSFINSHYKASELNNDYNPAGMKQCSVIISPGGPTGTAVTMVTSQVCVQLSDLQLSTT